MRQVCGKSGKAYEGHWDPARDRFGLREEVIVMRECQRAMVASRGAPAGHSNVGVVVGGRKQVVSGAYRDTFSGTPQSRCGEQNNRNVLTKRTIERDVEDSQRQKSTSTKGLESARVT